MVENFWNGQHRYSVLCKAHPCFPHAASSVRQSAFRVTQLILQQGLVSFTEELE